VVRDYVRESGLRLLPNWPARSPDLNVIENLWPRLNDALPNGNQLEDFGQLKAAVNRAWEMIPVSTAKELVESFPRRCQGIIDNDGFSLY
jgi:hypothetical protein